MATMNEYHSPVAQAARAMFPAALLARIRATDKEARAPDWLLALLRALRPTLSTPSLTRPARPKFPPSPPVRSAKGQPPQAPTADQPVPRAAAPAPPAQQRPPSNGPAPNTRPEDAPTVRSAKAAARLQEQAETAQPKAPLPPSEDEQDVSVPQQQITPATLPASAQPETWQAWDDLPLGDQVRTASTAAPAQRPAEKPALQWPPPDGMGLYASVSTRARPVSVEVTLRAADDLAAALAESDEITRAIYRTIARLLGER